LNQRQRFKMEKRKYQDFQELPEQGREAEYQAVP
jgi:hypothetical protein